MDSFGGKAKVPEPPPVQNLGKILKRCRNLKVVKHMWLLVHGLEVMAIPDKKAQVC